MKKFNTQFATQKLREVISGEDFSVNKVWDFLETRPFVNKEYMPKFNTAKEIYDEFGPKELALYAQYQWDGDDTTVHPREAAALRRRANYDALSGKKDLDEEGSVTGTGATFTAGAGEQYATTKAFKKVKKEAEDKETKLAAGKAKVYMKDKWDWKEAPSIPNRPSKGGFIYKQLYENLNENYSRFKKETKTRTSEQQLHAAMKLAEKKIHEANRILEYTAQLRTELTEAKVNKNTQKLMEKVTRGIAEAYGKMKKLK